MSSTVTSTTVAAIAAASFVAPLVLITIVMYFVLLVCKDLATSIADDNTRGKSLSQVLDVAVVPLIIVFVIVASANIASYLV
jgi:hypothetical protein